MKVSIYIALIVSSRVEIQADPATTGDTASRVRHQLERIRNEDLPIDGITSNGSTEERIRDLIVGGSLADSQEYRSYAVVDPVVNSGGLCGATLIYPDILVSAAHCGLAGIFNDGVLMNIGGTSIYGDDAIDRIGIDGQLIHPNYDSASLNNDIMLIKLSSPSSAPVSTWNTDDTVPGVNEALTIIGHGRTESGSASQFLVEATVFVVDDEQCVAAYAQSAGSIIDSDVVLCASSYDSTTCSGDSGGPLYSGGLLVGIVSFGIVSEFDGSCISNFPSGFTRISAYSDFIAQSICTLSASPPASCFAPVETPAPVSAPTAPPTSRPPTQFPVTSAPVATLPPVQFSITLTPFTPIPTKSPGLLASQSPSINESSDPSLDPSLMPSPIPTNQSNRPTALPTIKPSNALNSFPTKTPSDFDNENINNTIANNTVATVIAVEGENRGFGNLETSSSYLSNCCTYNAVVMGVLLYGMTLMFL
jgi:trypsin